MMPLSSIYQGLGTYEPLPNEATCAACGYFDVTHPDVQRILRMRVDLPNAFAMARCKCKGREQQANRKRDLRWQQANLPHPHHPRLFDNFHVLPSTEEMYQRCLSFSSGKGCAVLVLAGSNGPGKSHLLEAAVRAALESDHTARFEMSSALLERLRNSYQHDAEEDVANLMDWYGKLWLLALDDVGLERGTEWEREKLTRLVEDRITYEKRLIISTNLSYDEMAQRLGPRLASRLFPRNPDLRDVELVTVTAGDYRQQLWS